MQQLGRRRRKELKEILRSGTAGTKKQTPRVQAQEDQVTKCGWLTFS